MMTKLQIAMIACGSVVMATTFIGYYAPFFLGGPHPYWTAWMVVLAVVAFTVAVLSFASARREWKRRH